MNINYITISDLNRYIKAKFDVDGNLNNVYLKGEISNFKHHTRGHFYFTLKDESSRIAAVMFNFNASKVNFEPEDGMKVLVSGRISVYEATGSYQIYVNTMDVDGIGNLYLEYEKLKKKLAAEGLFDQNHKKPIPRFPKTIGIITAPTGAAIRDILSTIKRRYPIAKTILFPALVQGAGSKESIVKQLKKAQEYDLDVIMCGRGGVSIESEIPVISAVGHEPDVTIADFVADLRAPTPTGAAEMAVPNLTDLNNYLNQLKIRITKAMENNLNEKESHLKTLTTKQILKNPLSIYEIKEQKLDNLLDRLNLYINNKLKEDTLKYQRIIDNILFKEPKKLLERKEYQFNILLKTITILNPMKLLESGYSVVKSKDTIVTSIAKINKDDLLKITLKDGVINAKVVSKEGNHGQE